MNTIACCLLAALGAFSGELPPSDYADTEVSTNVSFAVNANLTDMMSIALVFAATPSNSVEVAIGHDADSDGNLSPEESAVVFGYDCGTWFQRSAARNRLLPAEPGLIRIRKSRDGISSDWNLAKVTRRGCGVTDGEVTFRATRIGTTILVR